MLFNLGTHIHSHNDAFFFLNSKAQTQFVFYIPPKNKKVARTLFNLGTRITHETIVLCHWLSNDCVKWIDNQIIDTGFQLSIWLSKGFTVRPKRSIKKQLCPPWVGFDERWERTRARVWSRCLFSATISYLLQNKTVITVMVVMTISRNLKWS